METISLPALILTIAFVALAAVHLAWAFGARWALGAVIPTRGNEPLFVPGRALTLLVAAALLAAAGIVLWRGAFPGVGPRWLSHAGTWAIAGVFALRAIGDFNYCGMFKRVRETRFARADTWAFTPLCLAISGLAIWLAAGP